MRPHTRPARPIRRVLLTSLALLTWTAAALHADVLVMKDGRRIEGEVLEKNDSIVKIETRFGVLTFGADEVESVEKKKTATQEYKERLAQAATAEDHYQLGLWAEKKRLKTQSKQCMARAIELDPKHAGAQKHVGNVLYGEEWVTPEERDRLAARDRENEMLAKGLVRYGDRWVTPEERDRLEAGMVFEEGRWMTFEESMRIKGNVEFQGRWIHISESIARQSVIDLERATQRDLAFSITRDALVCGDVPENELTDVGKGLERGRDWFDKAMSDDGGLELFGGRLAEIYMWNRDVEPYLVTVPHFGGIGRWLPDGWVEAVKRTHGFVFWDPYPVSSARKWHRPDSDLAGHCYHHWGHLLLNRVGYDGTLLPPWYDESFAGLTEFKTHDRNAVFCMQRTGRGTGTSAREADFDFDPASLRKGGWREVVGDALRSKRVSNFDKLAQKQVSDLALLDIAIGMAILEWIESRGPAALRAFHDALRRSCPKPPVRVIEKALDRQARYEEAFKAACGMGWREADQTWRSWLQSL